MLASPLWMVVHTTLGRNENFETRVYTGNALVRSNNYDLRAMGKSTAPACQEHIIKLQLTVTRDFTR